MPALIVYAPVTGWACGLDEAPDAVFSQRMLGDGLAIDPTVGEVRAPFDGTVTLLPASRHAISLRGDGGIEVLIHIGLETVALKGEGFKAHVAEGQRVAAGDLLISFDLKTVALGAASLITPIVVTGGGWTVAERVIDRSVVAGDPVLWIERTEATASSGGAGRTATQTIRSPLPHGLHARPAARVARLASGFAATASLITDARSASATSPVSMMALGLKAGDAVTVSAEGAEAQAAVAAIAEMILSGMGETGGEPDAAPTADADVASRPGGAETTSDGELIFQGVRAVPGLAIGKAVHVRLGEIALPAIVGKPDEERVALRAALGRVRERLEHEATGGSDEARAIQAAHIAFLQDPALLTEADAVIGAGGGGPLGWRTACRTVAEAFRTLPDARMAERAQDLMDLERQVLLELGGIVEAPAAVGAGDILLADDVLPSQMMALQGVGIGGLCTAAGGPTSHVAILAAALGIPALVAVGGGLDRVPAEAMVVLDADGGSLTAFPSAATQAAVESRTASARRRKAAARAAAAEPCVTADGVRIEIFANLGAPGEVAAAVDSGAEGCGLLRTEFLFLDRTTAPDEAAQAAVYQAIAEGLDGRPLVIRTLDAGGDKPLAYLPLPPEENPALGLRGLRTGLLHPQLLSEQLRAICRVRSTGPVAIMLPMVASVDEVIQTRRLLDQAATDVGRDAPLLGVMIETPAAAMTTDLLAPHIDFVSVGTNDLTQYALAMDRQNPSLAAQLDALHPAVLRLIAATASGATDLKWIGVCGSLASDPVAAPILVGLGVTELSAAPAAVAEVKAAVRSFSLQECRALAALALSAAGAAEVRKIAADALTRKSQSPRGAVA